jgi:cyclic pyranopterin phosphate synthase
MEDNHMELSHVDEKGAARMVDVSEKGTTLREAVATGRIKMQPATLKLIMEGGMPKGDVIPVARVAGIMAAKRTHEIIPMCHSIPLDSVKIEFEHNVPESCIDITAIARCTWKTGVEMEALTAVCTAALTIYDMCKAVDRSMVITDIRLESKSGGRSGDYQRLAE